MRERVLSLLMRPMCRPLALRVVTSVEPLFRAARERGGMVEHP
jgi:hypothetical protein